MRQDANREEILQVCRSPQEATLLSEMKKYLDLSEVVGYLDHMSSLESEHLWSELDRLDIREFAV